MQTGMSASVKVGMEIWLCFTVIKIYQTEHTHRDKQKHIIKLLHAEPNPEFSPAQKMQPVMICRL